MASERASSAIRPRVAWARTTTRSAVRTSASTARWTTARRTARRITSGTERCRRWPWTWSTWARPTCRRWSRVSCSNDRRPTRTRSTVRGSRSCWRTNRTGRSACSERAIWTRRNCKSPSSWTWTTFTSWTSWASDWPTPWTEASRSTSKRSWWCSSIRDHRTACGEDAGRTIWRAERICRSRRSVELDLPSWMIHRAGRIAELDDSPIQLNDLPKHDRFNARRLILEDLPAIYPPFTCPERSQRPIRRHPSATLQTIIQSSTLP